MIKKIFIMLMLMFVAIILFAALIFQGQQRRILMEMFIFPNTSGCGDIQNEVYRFVVENDGTLRSSQGVGIPNVFTEGRVWMFTMRRATITLSEQEFQDISDLLAKIAENDESEEWRSFGGWWNVIILYGGNIYDRSSACTLLLESLMFEIEQLSPLTSH